MGITLVNLGKRVEMTQGYLSLIENDKQIPSASSLERLADELEMDHSFLMKLAGYEEKTFGEKLLEYIHESDDSEAAIQNFAEQVELPIEAIESVIDNKVGISPDILSRFAYALPNVSYSTLLKDAGYEELARNEGMKEVLLDFGCSSLLTQYFDRIRALESGLDLKLLLDSSARDFTQLEAFKAQDVAAFYNGHRLKDEDMRRLATIIKEVFPEYEETGTDHSDYKKNWINAIDID